MDMDGDMIDDWLSGELVDSIDYDLYQINEYQRFFGLDEDENENENSVFSSYNHDDEDTDVGCDEDNDPELGY